MAAKWEGMLEALERWGREAFGPNLFAVWATADPRRRSVHIIVLTRRVAGKSFLPPPAAERCTITVRSLEQINAEAVARRPRRRPG